MYQQKLSQKNSPIAKKQKTPKQILKSKIKKNINIVKRNPDISSPKISSYFKPVKQRVREIEVGNPGMDDKKVMGNPINNINLLSNNYDNKIGDKLNVNNIIYRQSQETDRNFGAKSNHSHNSVNKRMHKDTDRDLKRNTIIDKINKSEGSKQVVS